MIVFWGHGQWSISLGIKRTCALIAFRARVEENLCTISVHASEKEAIFNESTHIWHAKRIDR